VRERSIRLVRLVLAWSGHGLAVEKLISTGMKRKWSGGLGRTHCARESRVSRARVPARARTRYARDSRARISRYTQTTQTKEKINNELSLVWGMDHLALGMDQVEVA